MRLTVLQELLTIKRSRDIWPEGWGHRTCIMGVINVTPDSFSDGGMFLKPIDALNQALKLVNHGADVLDIGAQSTRPGAIEVGSNEELKRLIPVVKSIRKKLPKVIISIDTFQSEVAKELLDIGADWINDITGGRNDNSMHNIIRRYKCPYVINHSRGNSQTMDSLTSYADVVSDVINELDKLTTTALNRGISTDQLLWDPGLGFAKTTEQNLNIIRNLDKFITKGFPLMIGPSRKRFIGQLTQEPIVTKRIWGTTAVASKCVQEGVHIIRVHDVEAIRKTILMSEAIWS